MRRKFLNIAAALSVVVCVVTVALWTLGSRRGRDVRGAYYSGTHFYVQVAANRLILSFNVVAGQDWQQFRSTRFRRLPDGFGLVRREGSRSNMRALPPLPSDPAFSGVALDDEGIWIQPNPAMRVSVFTAAADYWLILLAAAALAVLFRKTATARPKPGLCPRCGYDLRATPDHCPECGATADGEARADA